MGLQKIGELRPDVWWEYFLNDESRRSYGAFLGNQFTKEQTSQWWTSIKDSVRWDQPEGPHGPIPRKTAWFVAPGGCDCAYRYGRIEVAPQVYNPEMIGLMSVLMPLCGLNNMPDWPTCCNLNLYEDGGHAVGWHSDDEALFQGKFNDIRIISFTLGAKRKFEVRTNWPGEGERPVRHVMLGDGDLCTMEGMMQKHFQHRIPKEGGVNEPRINLTWRWILKHSPKCPACRRR